MALTVSIINKPVTEDIKSEIKDETFLKEER
jgi:hypothetical protein